MTRPTLTRTCRTDYRAIFLTWVKDTAGTHPLAPLAVAPYLPPFGRDVDGSDDPICPGWSYDEGPLCRLGSLLAEGRVRVRCRVDGAIVHGDGACCRVAPELDRYQLRSAGPSPRLRALTGMPHRVLSSGPWSATLAAFDAMANSDGDTDPRWTADGWYELAVYRIDEDGDAQRVVGAFLPPRGTR